MSTPVASEIAAPGAHPGPDGRCTFRVWAPAAERVEVRVLGEEERTVPLEPGERGYHSATVEDVPPGTRYFLQLDGGPDRPDPASRYQPDGVHGPSEVVSPDFAWRVPEFRGLPLEEYVVYELHVGTFTPEGTLDAAAARLEALRDLGITAVELMPVAQFPGTRNWGYDGVQLFAVQNSYGGPDALRRFVDRCHELGMAAVLDVVYNHLGPEGNYIPAVTGGRFFTDRHRTPWGDAVNVDGPGSGPVRDFIIKNALLWCVEYDVDGLRLDATHAILDDSPLHILAEMADAIAALPGRPRWLIAEDERNEPILVRPRAE
jgi:maltooligosyltrehalose trehalohydrolase